MALKNQVIPAQLQAGLDTGKDPKLVSQGMLRLENCVMDKQGELSKRPGLLALTGTYTDETLESLAVYKDRPVLVGDSILRKDGSSVTAGNMDTIGTAGGMDVDVQPLVALPSQFLNAEVQEAGSVQAVAYYVYDPIAATYSWKLDTFDRYSGVLIDSLSSDFQIRIIAEGGVIYYFKPSAASSPIHYSKVDSDGTINTSMQSTGGANTFTTFVGFYPFDVCLIGSDQLMLVHQLTTASGFEICTWEDVSFGAGTWRQGSILSPTTMGPIACAKLTEGVGVALWTDLGASPREVNAQGWDVEIAEQVTAATILTDGGAETFSSITAKAITSTKLRVYIAMNGGAVENSDVTFYNNYIDTAGTGSAETAPGSAPGWAMGLEPVSKPFGVIGSEEHYMLVQRTGYTFDDPNWTYWIMDSSANMVARVLGNYAYTVGTSIGAVFTRDTNQWILAAIRRIDEATASVQLVTVTYDYGQIHCVETPEHLQIAGSCPWETDGQQVVEQGFHVYPFHGSAAITTPGGATGIGEGVYGYKVVWEWRDNRRRRASRQAQSDDLHHHDHLQTIVVTLTIPNLFTTRKTNVTIAIYRTAVDGSHYYRLKSVAMGDTRTQDVTDSVADDTITDNEELYTAGGVVGNRAASRLPRPLRPPAASRGGQPRGRELGYSLQQAVCPKRGRCSFWVFHHQVQPRGWPDHSATELW